VVPCRRSFNRRWFGISEDWQYGETREFSSSVIFCLPSFQRFRSSGERERERERENLVGKKLKQSSQSVVPV